MHVTRYLTGRVALVTGGTRGVGLATAQRLCAAGADVYLNYANDDAGADAAVATLAGLAGTARALRADVRDHAALVGAIDEVGAAHGHLDVFVHNVASMHPMQATAASTPDVHTDLATALDPLLVGVQRLVKLMPAEHGRIIAVSSIGGHSVIPRYVSLGVAKAALESLVRYLAVELAPNGIAVNAVSTAKLDKGGEAAPRQRDLAAQAPSGRLATPADVADVVALLCRDEAHFIRGQVITVDGGLSLRAP